MQMTAEDFVSWTDALLSGEIPQTSGRLHKVTSTGKITGMCCLGVLSHLQKDILKLEVTVDRRNVTLVSYDGQRDFLPDKVMDRFGVEDNGPRIPIAALTQSELTALITSREQDGYSDGNPTISQLNDSLIPFPRLAELLKYGVDIIDNYTDRNIVKLRAVPGV